MFCLPTVLPLLKLFEAVFKFTVRESFIYKLARSIAGTKRITSTVLKKGNTSMKEKECLWYFAYGRNVNLHKLRKRIKGDPIKVCRGKLSGYKLVFGKVPGPKPGTGYATIIPRTEEFVEGALYLLRKQDLARLDVYEGVGRGAYRRCVIKVFNVDLKVQVDASTYVAIKVNERLKPPREYLAEIIEGARKIGLTQNWIARLERLMNEAL